MSWRVKPGQEKQFEQAVQDAARIARGHLGWGGNARLMVEFGFDRHLLPRGHRRLGNKRMRIKKMKSYMKEIFMQAIAEHVESNTVSKEEA